MAVEAWTLRVREFFLESGDLGEVDGGALNLLTEGGNGLHVVEKRGADAELGLVAHGRMSQ